MSCVITCGLNSTELHILTTYIPGNEWCIFDLQATADEDVAMASKVAYEEAEAVKNASENGKSRTYL